MKLLVILPRVPYPTEKGDKLRAFHQLKILSKYHEIILCAFNDKPVHPEAEKVLSNFCKEIHIFKLKKRGFLFQLFNAFLTGLPFQVAYFYRKKYKKAINNIISKQNPDHIYCQLLRTAQYVKNVKIPKTLDYQDVFSMGIKRRLDRVNALIKPIFWLEYKRLLKYENTIFNWFDNKTIISIPDRDLIPHVDKNSIYVIPNGVDFDFFSPQNSKPNFDIVFTGNMGYAPNILAANFLVNKILPLVQQKIPNCKIIIAGANPHPKVLQLRSKNVKVTGWMQDIRSAYLDAKIFIAPMQIGTGLQNKLLEAMAMQLPCITTNLANNALKAENNKNILIGDTERELANNIIKLLSDKEFADTIAKNGRQFVIDNYSWETNTLKLNHIISSTKQ